MKILLEKPKFRIVINKTGTPTIKKKNSGTTQSHKNENITAKQNPETMVFNIPNPISPIPASPSTSSETYCQDEYLCFNSDNELIINVNKIYGLFTNN
jgi:hypothetical protein